MGGSVSVEEPVAGDLTVSGFSIYDTGRASGSVFLIGANVTAGGGAGGPITIYANNVALDGNFADDVTIFAGGRITIAPTTTIVGKLTYEAPEEAFIPESAHVLGGISYTNASYLPDVGTSRFLSLVSIGFFLLVRILGALILAGLLAGLFPRLSERVVGRAVHMRVSRILLTILLGFAIFIVTPILALLLALTFVGIGLAFMLFTAYALVVSLAVLFAGIMVGSLLVRRFVHRDIVLWRDGVIGMLVLSGITLIPYIGLLTAFLCTAFSAGTLLLIFFEFAFPHEIVTPELL
jgi:hypothetical protein